MEYFVISKMLEQGLDVYIPLIDDDAIDVVIRKNDGSFVEIQIKARSKSVKFGNAALFAAINHEVRKNYYFVFYSHRLDKTWILSSKEFLKEAGRNKSGKNIGKYSICFNGSSQVTNEEYPKEKFNKYLNDNFNIFK